MTNELATSDETSSEVAVVEGTSGFAGIQHQKPLNALVTNDFLPLCQFLSSKSEAVVGGVVPEPGYYIRHGTNKYTSLGREIILYPITYRELALDTSNKPDKIISVRDTADPEFARIQQDSEEQDSGCMWGPEFLVWVPGWKVSNRFATFFCSSKSARREANNFEPILAKQGFAKMGFGLITTKKYKYQNITVQSYSGSIELPPLELLKTELAKFQKPPGRVETSDTEETTEEEVEGERPR